MLRHGKQGSNQLNLSPVQQPYQNMAHKGQTGSFEVSVCYQERTNSLLVGNNMTVSSFLPIAVNFFLHKTESIEKYKIIYAGSVLKNEVLLKDLQLCTSSVLHMVNTEKKNHLSSQNESKEYSYYVYCYECKDIASAQLRIKCQQCGQCQRFLIDKQHVSSFTFAFLSFITTTAFSHSACFIIAFLSIYCLSFLVLLRLDPISRQVLASRQQKGNNIIVKGAKLRLTL
ncbi:uncharacterized protein LOC118767830 [Octopus sinensis]|uniref:Uncharacterized protein LOC118767830 n=1 Tax=Octopus sinensis TaxID=2607531 RepID=A0A7E6FMZ7_9MOLL|nr:uncharacterized protein LOC118767830 [Octopus sinensis]